MIEVDRAMVEDFNIQLIQMMENAGRNLAHLARIRFLKGDPRGKKVIVLAGSGGNGGGALVCAWRLVNFGAQVHVYLTKQDLSLSPTTLHQLVILRRIGLQISLFKEEIDESNSDLIIDGIIGYSLIESPRELAAQMIIWANEQNAPTLALDIPSGVDSTNGTIYNPAIKAAATMTLALPKKGLLNPNVESHTGEVYLADIGVPASLYSRPPLNIEVGFPFAESELIQILRI